MADPGAAARGRQTRSVLVSHPASTLVVRPLCVEKGLSVLSRHPHRLLPPTDLELLVDVGLASWILTVVVLCDHFRHTRNNSLLHAPLIDVPWLFPSSSQDECSDLTRRALLPQHSDTHLRWEPG